MVAAAYWLLGAVGAFAAVPSVIHADGYSGFDELFAGDRIAKVLRRPRRRRLTDRQEALDRIGELYGVEEMITGLPADRRRAARQQRSQPIAEALRIWTEQALPKLSRKSGLAKAFRYMRSRVEGAGAMSR